ncbi:hypothetical protein Val02_77710 [Virgisporangium aliadipatigenens]|uniref:Lipoprotein n=1 Tax=Virgisporangium aliadipatigenens TaxID=741659 RepID=A0A8J3YW44_9ACTN|nr:hypothetical protein [Virgisporangium aliadipatigenens]GIJ50885.1 hypothetical protein Val02_77710 [Virgisporangium aliadipatigenens]
MRVRQGLALTLLAVLLTAGCAGKDGGGDDVASATGDKGGATPTAGASPMNEQERAAKFGDCMRANGLPEFKDPEVEEGRVGMMVPEGTDKATVDAAMAKCKEFLPGGGELRKPDAAAMEQMRKHAQCMRENGIPDFPDPSEEGGIALDLDKLGLSGPDDPRLKAAEEACKQYMPEGPGAQKKTG